MSEDNEKIEFQAYGNAGRVTACTPRQAAAMYFGNFPRSRKCNLCPGVQDGDFFIVRVHLSRSGEYAKTYRGVTKKQVPELPDEV